MAPICYQPLSGRTVPAFSPNLFRFEYGTDRFILEPPPKKAFPFNTTNIWNHV